MTAPVPAEAVRAIADEIAHTRMDAALAGTSDPDEDALADAAARALDEAGWQVVPAPERNQP